MATKDRHLDKSQIALSQNYNSLYSDVCTIIEDTREGVYRAVNVAIRDFPITDWKIGTSYLDTLLSAAGCH